MEGFVAKFAGGEGVSSKGMRKDDEPFLGVEVFFGAEVDSSRGERDDESLTVAFGGVRFCGVPVLLLLPLPVDSAAAELLRVVRFTTLVVALPFCVSVSALLATTPFVVPAGVDCREGGFDLRLSRFAGDFTTFFLGLMAGCQFDLYAGISTTGVFRSSGPCIVVLGGV